MTEIYKIHTNKRESFFKKISLTNKIILLNILFYIVSLIIVSTYGEDVYLKNIAINSSLILSGKTLWTFITSMFSHLHFFHLFANMLSLFFIGNFLEKLIGRKRFFLLYLISGITAGLLFVIVGLFGFNIDVSAVGASGALFGIAGLLAVITPRLPVMVFFIIPMPMWLAVISLLVILWLLSAFAGLPIGNVAHLGGLITGVVYGFYLRHKYKKKVKLIEKYFR